MTRHNHILCLLCIYFTGDVQSKKSIYSCDGLNCYQLRIKFEGRIVVIQQRHSVNSSRRRN
jgi:hypothetical protein